MGERQRYAGRIRDQEPETAGGVTEGFTLAFEGGPLDATCRLHVFNRERPNETFRYLVVMRLDAVRRVFEQESYSLDASDWDENWSLTEQRDQLRAVLADPEFRGFLLGMYRFSADDECLVWMPNPPLADLM